MPRDGATIFSDLIGKLDTVYVACSKCGRSGRYRLRCLIDQRGRDAATRRQCLILLKKRSTKFRARCRYGLKRIGSLRLHLGGMLAQAPFLAASALIQSASYPRSASSIVLDFRRERSLPASRLSCASPAVSASRTGRPLVSTTA